MKSQLLPVLALSLVLAACAQQGIKTKSKDLPRADTLVSPDVPLTSDIIFSVIAGELQAQRGHLPEAFEHMLAAAELAGDPVMAERAVRAALFNKDMAGALVAVNLWVSLLPKDLAARQMAVLLSVKMKASDERILQHLMVVIELSEQAGKDGFVESMHGLSPRENPEQALSLLQVLAKKYPDKAMAAYVVALAGVMAKQIDIAEKAVRRAIVLDPDMDKARVLLSRILMVNHQNELAIELLYDAISDMPDSILLRTALAQTLLEADKVEASYQQYQALARLDPSDSKVVFSLGILAIQQKDYEQAKQYLLSMIEKGGNPSDAYYHLGWVSELQENTAQALVYYQQVQTGKWRVDAGGREALLMAGNGQVKAARDLLQRLRNSIAGSALKLTLVEIEILQEYGEASDVLPFYQGAFKEFPSNHELLYSRAMYFADIDELILMEVDLLAILQADPVHVNALNTLGYVLADKTHRYDEALAYITKALSLAKQSPAVIDSMGWVKYRMGELKQALTFLTQAYDQLQDAEISAHLGEVLWFYGDKQKAEKVWSQAIRAYPDSPFLNEAKRLMEQGQ